MHPAASYSGHVERPDSSVISLRRATVLAVESSRPGAVELTVGVDGRSEAALAYPSLTGSVGIGDEVIVNSTALELGLGTGGYHLVVSVTGRDVRVEGSGRVMKARYTPLQVAVRSVEEEHAEALESSPGLGGTPVVAAPLHSMVAPASAGAKAAGARRVAYVMTDGASIPGPFSRLVPRLREAGLLDGWITAGQAFGGELEAVTIWTALLAAVELLRADVVIVADGPGNLGTATTWGSSGLTSAHALDAAAALDGRPIAALRVSFADERARHRGLSHHSSTILARACRPGVHVAVPVIEDAAQRASLWDALRAHRLEERHQLVEADGRPALATLAERDVEIESMGRSPGDDPAFFLAAGAAGVLAGRMADAARSWSTRAR
jgi:Protein of unknown function (DUF3866)